MLGAVHKWRQHFLGSLTPLGAYVSLSSAFGMPLGASNWWCHLWTALNQKRSFLESGLFPSDLTESVLHITWPWKNPNHCSKRGPVQPSETQTKACFGWIPSNRWIFHHSSSFLMTLGPSWSAFVSFLTPYCRWVDISTWTPSSQIWLYLRHSS